MDRSHYTVLAQVSLSYSVPEGRFPRVTHPCATKAEAFVRLACVRHAASVRSEPGSNSQVCVTFKPVRPEGRQPAGMSFKEPIPALVKRNGYEGHMRLGLINRYPELEAPRTGRRRPHFPSSKPTMSKSHRQNEADNNRSPIFSTGGLLSVFAGDRSVSAVLSASPRR